MFSETRKIVNILKSTSRISSNRIDLSNYRKSKNYTTTVQDESTYRIENDSEKYFKRMNLIEFNSEQQNLIRNGERNLNKHIFVKKAIKAMDILCEEFSRNKELRYEHVKDSNEFVHMCEIIQKNAKNLHTYEVIHILHALLFLNVPPNSLIIQTLLQLIRVTINDLSIGQIMIVYYALTKIKEMPLAKCILISLPYVFKQQARVGLSTGGDNLFKALRFSNVVNETNVMRDIINILCKNKQTLNFNYITDIFYAFYSSPKLCITARKLFFNIKNAIIHDATSLTLVQIEKLLHYISKNYKYSNEKLYDREMVDALCAALLNKPASFQECISVLKHLNNINYSSPRLLDALVEKCLHDKDIFQKSSDHVVKYLISGLSIANYKPHGWEIIGTMLKDFVMHRIFSVRDAVFVAFHLLSLEIYYPDLLHKVFFLYNTLPVSVKDRSLTLATLQLHWCVKRLYPQYDGHLIQENELNSIVVSSNGNSTPSVTKSLIKTVEGVEYIKEGLTTRFGKYIDYAVVLQPNGTLMNISHYNVTFVEELVPSARYIKILFLVPEKHDYSINKRNLLSTVNLQLQAIKTLPGYHPFVINPYVWNELSDTEKTSYLREVIALRRNGTERTSVLK